VDHVRACQLADRRVPGDQEDGDRRLDRAADAVGREHHQLARQPVGPDAADEEQHDADAGAEREDQAEVGGAAADVKHCERERDEDEAVAERRSRTAEPDEAVGAVTERSEAAHATIVAGATAAASTPRTPGASATTMFVTATTSAAPSSVHS
jgi:hypothetical protein